MFGLPEKAKDDRRKAEEDVRNQKSCEHIGLPVSSVQDQQISAFHYIIRSTPRSHVREVK